MTLTDSASREATIRVDLSFWRWFVRSGIRRFVDRWLLVHVAVGLLLARYVPERMSDVSRAAFLPLASILIGLAFAWGGNALAVLQTTELRRVASDRSGPGYSSYIFTFQQAILVVLVTLIVWGLLAMGIANSVEILYRSAGAWLLGRATTFALTSLAIRECWHVILGTQSMMIIRHIVQTENEQRSEGGAARNDDT
jgi:hypothetical protein